MAVSMDSVATITRMEYPEVVPVRSLRGEATSSSFRFVVTNLRRMTFVRTGVSDFIIERKPALAQTSKLRRV